LQHQIERERERDTTIEYKEDKEVRGSGRRGRRRTVI
jgi:hypothetical protein